MDVIQKYKYQITILLFVTIGIVIIHHMMKYRQQEHMENVMYSDISEKEDNILQRSASKTMDVNPILGQSKYPTEPEFSGSAIDYSKTEGDLLPIDLLPKSMMVSGESTNPVDLTAKNFLIASTTGAFGIDTVGSSNKNASLDIRGGIPIKANLNTSPWNVSSFTGNPYERVMTIG